MAEIVDSYVEANHANAHILKRVFPSGDAVHSSLGQSFTGDGKPMDSCKFYLGVRVGNPGNLRAYLYAHTGTFGISSLPTGAILDQSSSYAASNVLEGDNWSLHTFTGFAGYTPVNGTKYCIVLVGYDGTWDASNHISVSGDNTSPTHGGNAVYYNAGSWNANSGLDIIFYVYGVPPVVVGRSFGFIIG